MPPLKKCYIFVRDVVPELADGGGLPPFPQVVGSYSENHAPRRLSRSCRTSGRSLIHPYREVSSQYICNAHARATACRFKESMFAPYHVTRTSASGAVRLDVMLPRHSHTTHLFFTMQREDPFLASFFPVAELLALLRFPIFIRSIMSDSSSSALTPAAFML